MSEKFKYLNLVEKIRSKDKAYLSDPRNLEKELLLELGLNDEFVKEYPSHLRKYCGKGLKSWQYPNQFSKYLVHLSKYKIESYLELGVRHGGTFIITVEYLNKFHPIKRALGIDVNDCPVISEYSKFCNPAADFWKVNTKSLKFDGFSNHCNGIDLTLIDADHAFSAVEHDLENVQKMSRMIALHDISNDACVGVKKVWGEMQNDKNRYDFCEFIEQYHEFKKSKKSFFGIGVAGDKVLPLEKNE